MKNKIRAALAVLFLILMFSGIQAQKKAQKLPMDNKVVFEKFLNDVYAAYYQAYEKKDYRGFARYFGGNAAEIYPDGHLVYTLKNLKVAWKESDAMLDEKPNFVNKLTSSRMISPEVALITWESEADMKAQGQQVGGKFICHAVLKKKGNDWSVEFDGITPIIPRPEMPAPEPPAAEPTAAEPEN